MVFPGERDYMEIGPERSKTLHNFTLPNLKWGSQRHLRCMKVDSATGGGGNQRLRRRSSPLKFESSSEAISVPFCDGDLRSENQHRRFRSALSKSAENGSVEEIEELGEKIMSDLRTVAERMTESICRKEALGDEEQPNGVGQEEKSKEKEKQKESEFSSVTAAARPWNLRTRRAACKAPIPGVGNNNGNQYDGFNLNNDLAMSAVAGGNTNKRQKFCLSLTKKEIEEDFTELLGHRPHRRPKKRPKTVQKHLDFLFPGLYLKDFTLDTYKVPESMENGKR